MSNIIEVARSVTVIIAGREFSHPSSNLNVAVCTSHNPNTLVKGMDRITMNSRTERIL